jgi:hypothetical protein
MLEHLHAHPVQVHSHDYDRDRQGHKQAVIPENQQQSLGRLTRAHPLKTNGEKKR